MNVPFPLMSYLSGFSAQVPVTRLTNQDIETFADTSDEWIVTRTGIRERRILAKDELASSLAIKAAKNALERSGLAPEAITHTVVATCTPDGLSPASACVIASALNLPNGMAFDINAGCTGFLYALHVCRAMLLAEPEARILLVCVEGISRRINWRDRNTCVLFGDGAGACILTRKALPNATVSAVMTDILCSADSSFNRLITIGGGSSKPYECGEPVDESFFVSMQGREVFKHAVRDMVALSRQLLARNNLSAKDIDLFVPHQANLRIIEAVGARLQFGSEQVFSNVERYGNTSAASIPLAISDAILSGKIHSGMRVLIASFGSGLTWGGALLQFQ